MLQLLREEVYVTGRTEKTFALIDIPAWSLSGFKLELGLRETKKFFDPRFKTTKKVNLQEGTHMRSDIL